MFDRKYTGLVAGFFFSFILSIAMAIIMTYVNTGALTLMPIFMTFLEAFVISYIAAAIIPVNKIGGHFAGFFKAKPNSFAFNLLSNIPISLILVAILSFSLTAINVGFIPQFIMAWLSGVPVALAVVYAVSVIITPLVGWLTNSCMKDEAAAQ